MVTDDVERLLSRAAIPPHLATRVVTPPRLLELLATEAVAAAVVDGAALTPDLEVALTGLRDSGVQVPLIEVVPATLRRTLERPAWATAFVPAERTHIDLIPVVRQGAVNAALESAAAALSELADSDDRADVLLCSVPTRVPPLRSIGDAARIAQCAPDTLNRRWANFHRHTTAVTAEPMSLKAHFDWPILLRALGEKRAQVRWEEIAAWLDVSTKRLRALAQTYCATPLNVLVREEPLLAPEAYTRELRERLGVRTRWSVPD